MKKYYISVYIYIHPEKLQSHKFDLKSSTALEHILNEEAINKLGMNEKGNYPKNFIKSRCRHANLTLFFNKLIF